MEVLDFYLVEKGPFSEDGTVTRDSYLQMRLDLLLREQSLKSDLDNLGWRPGWGPQFNGFFLSFKWLS
jgi:hypothetical protein